MDTLDDFIAKYRNTFVFLKLKDKPNPILVEFTEANGNESLTFENIDIGKIKVKYNTAWNQLSFDFPKKGIYNIGKLGFSLVERFPERQYKRAPCSKNLSITRIFNFLEQQAINFKTIEECFFPKYPNSREEAEHFCKERVGVALSNRFGIVPGDKHKYLLFYYNDFIGTIDYDYKINVLFDPVLQEVKDFFGDNLVWKN